MTQQIERDTSRRHFIAMVGGGAAALAVFPRFMMGCGASPSGEETPEGDWVTVAVSDYPDLQPVGGMVLIEITGEDLTLAVVHLDDGYAALDGTCTHQGCLVGEFDTSTSEVVCNCHNSTFDLSGEPTGGPASEPLTVYETEYDAETDEVRIQI